MATRQTKGSPTPQAVKQKGSYYLNLSGDENDRCGKKIYCRKKETPDVWGKRHGANRIVQVQCAA